MPWYDDLLAPVGMLAAGAGLSYLGSSQEIDAAQEAEQVRAASLARNADAALQQAQPYGVGGAGGTFDTDPESRTALLNLSPELQNIYQGALTRSGLWGQQVMNLAGADPFESADMFYQQGQEMIAPEEAQLRSDAETRLLAQGRLGSTGGQRAMGELEKQILMDRDRRRLGSMNQAQQLITSLLGRESADLSTATGLLDIPVQYGNLGRGISANLGTAALGGLQSRAAGAAGLAGVMGASPFGSTLSGIGGLFTSPRGSGKNSEQSLAQQAISNYFN
jgi:type II secretory pathway pseudopilin PulG